MSREKPSACQTLDYPVDEAIFEPRNLVANRRFEVSPVRWLLPATRQFACEIQQFGSNWKSGLPPVSPFCMSVTTCVKSGHTRTRSEADISWSSGYQVHLEIPCRPIHIGVHSESSPCLWGRFSTLTHPFLCKTDSLGIGQYGLGAGM